jgi:hypothetical protein
MTAAAAVLPVQIEVTGPDSKAVKSNYAAFHTFRNGRTALSCSGLLLLPPPGQQQQQQQQQQAYHVLAPVTSLYPFLQQSQRSNIIQATSASLLAGVELSVLFQQQQQPCSKAGVPPDHQQQQQQQQQLVRLPAKLLQVLPLPRVPDAADELLTSANSSGVGSWKLGWLLAGAWHSSSTKPEAEPKHKLVAQQRTHRTSRVQSDMYAAYRCVCCGWCRASIHVQVQSGGFKLWRADRFYIGNSSTTLL